MLKITKKKILSLFVLILIALPFTAQEENADPELLMEIENQKEEKEKAMQPDQLQKNFTIIESVKPHELNPYITSYSSDSQILSGLYEGLFSYHPVTLEPQYAIACGYKISRDKKRWTINLRPEAKFSNGEEITAQSVKDAWLELLSTPNAPYASLLDIIRGAADFRNGNGRAEDVGLYVVDEHTLSIYLTKPANYLPKVLCHSAFSVVNRNPTVYSGAFYLEDLRGNTYVLKRNPYYWDVKNVRLEQITFIQSDDKDKNVYLYNTGSADWVTADVDSKKVLDSQAMQLNAEFGTSYDFFRTSKKKASGKTSVWDYQEFRNVVLEAFPWDIVRGNALVPATTLVYPLNGYPQVEGFSYTDALEASLKMKDARQKYNIPDEQILELEFAVTKYTFNEEQKTAIEESLLPLGIQVIYTEIPTALYLESLKISDADIFCYTWIGDFADPLAFLELFRSNSTLNETGWESEEYDQLLDKAASVSDSARLEILAQAENLLLDSGIVIPIYHPVCFNLIDLKEVGGWSTNAFDIHPLKYLYKKVEVKTDPNGILVRY